MAANQTIYVAMKGQDAELNNVDVDGDLVVAGDTTFTGATAFDGGATGASQLRRATQTLTATGAITITNGLVMLNHATVVIAATLAAPTAGDELFIVDSSASGTAAHTVTLSGVTFDGTNSVATFNAPGEALHLIALSATRWFILENIGSVALS